MDFTALQSTSDDVAFINSLELDEPRYSLTEIFRRREEPEQPSDNKKESYVVAGGLAAFTDRVSGLVKQYILDATLLAQLSADKKYNRTEDTLKWYDYYNQILRKIGFVMRNFDFRVYETQGRTLQIDEVVKLIHQEVASAGESAIIVETLTALRRMANSDHEIALFDEHSSHNTLGNFQVYSCEQAPNGQVSLSIGAFFCRSETIHNTYFFFFHSDTSSTRIFCGAQRSFLSTEVYERVRAAVSAKISGRSRDLVASVDL